MTDDLVTLEEVAAALHDRDVLRKLAASWEKCSRRATARAEAAEAEWDLLREERRAAQSREEDARAEHDELYARMTAAERERDEAVALVAKMRRFVTGTAAGRPLMPSIDALLAKHPRQEGNL